MAKKTLEDHRLDDAERDRCREEGIEIGRREAQDDAYDRGFAAGQADRQGEVDALKAEVKALAAELEKHTGCCAGES